MISDADLLLTWLVEDIANRGGTGRRVSRIEWQSPLAGMDRRRIREAIKELVVSGQAWLDFQSGHQFGFVYLVPAGVK